MSVKFSERRNCTGYSKINRHVTLSLAKLIFISNNFESLMVFHAVYPTNFTRNNAMSVFSILRYLICKLYTISIDSNDKHSLKNFERLIVCRLLDIFTFIEKKTY